MKKRSLLHDAIEMIALGTQSLAKDDFSRSFTEIRPKIRKYTPGNYLSVLIRFGILLPFRVFFFICFFLFLSILFIIVLYMQNENLINICFYLFMKLFLYTLNIRATHFGRKSRHNFKHIYVSNHTSFIDFIVLSGHKFAHACISENHGGLFGLFMDFIIVRNGSIIFKRSEKKDRDYVLKKIGEHLKNNKVPMLIFPEGTCVNNTRTILFQKGAFEYKTHICPVAIKYNKNLMNPYWNRRKHGFFFHLIYLLSRWGIDVEVHWMDPVAPNKNENSLNMCYRVKKLISDKISIQNSLWNGYFKSLILKIDCGLLQIAYKNVYKFIKCEMLENINQRDFITKKEYLQFRGINPIGLKDKLYFGKLTYNEFIHECTKEYLRLKSLPFSEREIIINNNLLFSTASFSSINTIGFLNSK